MGLLLVGFVLGRSTIKGDQLQDLISGVKDHPLLPIFYVLFYIVAVIFALPGVALTLLSGPLFGFSKGVVLVTIGANIGCSLTFFISRFIARDFVQSKMKKYDKMAVLSDQIEDKGFSYLFYIRLLPIFPFNLINYLMGMTSISYKAYALASLFGMLPGIVFYVYLSTQVTRAPESLINFIWPFIVAGLFFGLQRLLIKWKEKKG